MLECESVSSTSSTGGSTDSEVEENANKVRVVGHFVPPAGRAHRSVTFEDNDSPAGPSRRRSIRIVGLEDYSDTEDEGAGEGTGNAMDDFHDSFLDDDVPIEDLLNSFDNCHRFGDDDDGDDDDDLPSLDPDSNDEGGDDDSANDVLPEERRKKKPLDRWRELREETLYDLHCADAGPDGWQSCGGTTCADDVCAVPCTTPPIFRCLDCVDLLMCGSCIGDAHTHQPFHTVEVRL